jgi:hypothetical protein
MGMYDVFETDGGLEVNGVWIDYGDFRILIASAGQGNKSYVRYAEKKLKPVRRALEVGAVDMARQQGIMADIYAKTIILGWETIHGKGDDTKMKTGIEDKNGKIVPFTKENVITALKALPRLFLDLQEQASSLATFRKEETDEEGKNSQSS